MSKDIESSFAEAIKSQVPNELAQNSINWIFKQALQSQADEYDREKGQMVREIHKELTTPMCMVDSGVCTNTITYQAVSATIKTISQKYGVDLSE